MLNPKDEKKSKKIFWTSEEPDTTGRQRICYTYVERTNYSVPNTKATEIENIECTFNLFS